MRDIFGLSPSLSDIARETAFAYHYVQSLHRTRFASSVDLEEFVATLIIQPKEDYEKSSIHNWVTNNPMAMRIAMRLNVQLESVVNDLPFRCLLLVLLVQNSKMLDYSLKLSIDLHERYREATINAWESTAKIVAQELTRPIGSSYNESQRNTVKNIDLLLSKSL